MLLPDYPLDLLERGLRDVGFTNFLRTKNGVPVEVDGLRLMISAAVAPTDGPLGDSGLSVDDGEVRIFDQNDSRPVDLDALAGFGPYDAHFLQFSGAIWYPMVYQYPEKMKEALGRKKRENELARALRFAKEIGATHIIPSAGPPCFLDDDLCGFNDFDRDPIEHLPRPDRLPGIHAGAGLRQRPPDDSRQRRRLTKDGCDRRASHARRRGAAPSSARSAPTWKPIRRASSTRLTPRRRRGRAARWTSSRRSQTGSSR